MNKLKEMVIKMNEMQELSKSGARDENGKKLVKRSTLNRFMDTVEEELKKNGFTTGEIKNGKLIVRVELDGRTFKMMEVA